MRGDGHSDEVIRDLVFKYGHAFLQRLAQLEPNLDIQRLIPAPISGKTPNAERPTKDGT